MEVAKSHRVDFVRNETDVFSEVGYDLSIQSTSEHQYHSQTSISTTTPATFFIQGNDLQYIALDKIKIYARCKLTQKDGTDIADHASPETRVYFPVNNTLGSVFEKVIVQINETEVTQKTSLYPFKSYFENLTTYGREYKKTQAEAAGFFRTKDETSDADESVTKRKTMSKTSAVFELIGKLNVSLFNQPRLLLPGNDLRLALHQSPNAFSLICKGANKIEAALSILELKLIVPKHTLLPSIHLSHLKIWEKHPLIYPSIEGQIKSYSLPTGTQMHTNESLISGLLPYRLLLAIAPTTSVHGSYDSNPFDFQLNGLNQITVTVNGEQTSQKTITLDSASKRLLEGYFTVFDGMGVSNCDPGIDIRFDEWKKGKSIFIFNFQDASEDALAIPKHGNVTIHLQFSEATGKSLTVLVYAEYPSTMYIRNDRQVIFKDYTSDY